MLSKVMEVFWLQMVIRMWCTSGISESFEKKKRWFSISISRDCRFIGNSVQTVGRQASVVVVISIKERNSREQYAIFFSECLFS